LVIRSSVCIVRGNMNVRHTEHSPYPAVIPAERALPASPAQRSFHVPSPYSSGEIIDCLEIHSDNDPSTLGLKNTYPVHADHPPPAKGRWIDIWI
jgi:hypothetical protein